MFTYESWSHMVTRSCVAHWQVYFYPLEQDGILEGPASTFCGIFCQSIYGCRRRMRKLRKSYRCCKITDSDNKLSLLYQHQRNITWNMISSHVKRSPLLWLHNKLHLSQQKLLIVKPCIWWKNCAPGDKSTKFGMIMVLGLLNNISYGPQSRGGDLYLRGGGFVAVST